MGKSSPDGGAASTRGRQSAALVPPTTLSRGTTPGRGTIPSSLDSPEPMQARQGERGDSDSSMHRAVAIIPVYNHGDTVAPLAGRLAACGLPVILINDGSDARCAATLRQLAAKRGPDEHGREKHWPEERGTITLIERAANGGKGAAVKDGLREAARRGYTHALQLDADGQHDAADAPRFLALSRAKPEAVICGVPDFSNAPRLRYYGRRFTHLWVWINTLSLDIRDAMCGFRVYPLASALRILDGAPLGDRMDFDIEILARLHWAGVEIAPLRAAVNYPPGGISHFRAVRDNLLISRAHARLFFGMLRRLPMLLRRKLRRGWLRRKARQAISQGSASSPQGGAPAHQSNGSRNPQNRMRSPQDGASAPTPTVERWQDIREVGFLAGLRLLFWIYRWGGFLAFRIILQPVLAYYFLRNAVARRASLDYLRRLNKYFQGGSHSPLPRPGLRSAYRHFNAFAVSSLDRLAVWAGGFGLRQRIDFPNWPMLRRQLSAGQGAVLLGAHLGNMEILCGLSTLNPALRLCVLVHTRHAGMFNHLLREVAGEGAVSFMEVSEFSPATAIDLQARVARGDFIAVLADRVPPSMGGNSRGRGKARGNERGEVGDGNSKGGEVRGSGRCTRVSFLGHPAYFPDGPFILASLLKCPVYTLFCARAGRRYQIRCEKFADAISLPRRARREALAAYIRQYVAALEDNICRHPLQWFNFYPFWEDGNGDESETQ